MLSGRIKYITVLRHGESHYNEFRKNVFLKCHWRHLLCYDPGLRDTVLTSQGVSQAYELSKKFDRNTFDLILVSPLTRSISTALIVTYPEMVSDSLRLNKENNAMVSRKKLLVTPLLTEWLDTTSDSGVSLQDLQNTFQNYESVLDWNTWLQSSSWDQNIWWYNNTNQLPWPQRLYRRIHPEPKQNVLNRIQMLKKFLSSRKEQSICIIGHSWFLKLLTDGRKLKNCEMQHYIYDCVTQQFFQLRSDGKKNHA